MQISLTGYCHWLDIYRVHLREGSLVEQITLDISTVKKLQKESSGNQSVLHHLCRESVARKWLKSNEIPSWRNPSTPLNDTDNGSSHDARYSILLADGSRFLVCSYPFPYPHYALSRDMLAAAKCFAALAVGLEKDCRQGSIMGCAFLKDISRTGISDFNQGGLESTSKLLHYLTVHSSYKAKFIRFSIKLLLFGEPDAPERGTDGVSRFVPVRG